MKGIVVPAMLLTAALLANVRSNAVGDEQRSTKEALASADLEATDTAAVVLVSARIDSSGRAMPDDENSCYPEELFEDALRLVAATDFSSSLSGSDLDTGYVFVPVVFHSATVGKTKNLVPRVGKPENWKVSSALVPPIPVHREPPGYPKQARTQNLQGKALIEVLVDQSGNVSSAKVVSGADDLLSMAALKAARKWKFKPASYRGWPMCTRIRIPFEFSIH